MGQSKKRHLVNTGVDLGTPEDHFFRMPKGFIFNLKKSEIGQSS